MNKSIASKAGVVVLALMLGACATKTGVARVRASYGIIPTCRKPRTPRVIPFEPG